MTDPKRIVPPPPEDEFLADIIKVPTEQLFIDHRYQRGVKKSSVKNLVENWSWKRYIPVIVVHRGGTGQPDRYAVVDGQQRTMAAQELGIEWLPAVLIVSRSLEDEAERFVGANTGAPVGAGDRFRAEYLRKEPRYVAIAEEVRSAGFELSCISENTARGNRDPYSIEAVHTVEGLYQRGMLKKVLNIIAASWGDSPIKDMVAGAFLDGVYLALKHLERFDVTDIEIIKAFSGQSVKQTLDMGHERYKSMVTSRSIPGGIAAVLIERFNYRKPAAKTVPPYDRSAARALASSAGARAQIERGTIYDVRRATTPESRRAGGISSAASSVRKSGRFVKKGR